MGWLVALILILWTGSADATGFIVGGVGIPASAPTPPPPSCQTIPGTSTPVGAACFASQIGSCPALTGTTQDPINFGADKTGVVDSSDAISHAIVAGGGVQDIKFGTAGTYLVDLCADCVSSGNPHAWCTGAGNTTSACNGTNDQYIVPVVPGVSGGQASIQPPASIKFECVPGVTLKFPFTSVPHDSAILWFRNGGNVACGCDFQGGATGPPPYQDLSPPISLIAISGNSNYTIEDNTFEKTVGNSAVETINDTGNPSNVTVTYNTSSALAYYDIVDDSPVTNMTVTHNLGTDNVSGLEWDGCGSGNYGSGILWAANMITTSVGGCRAAGQSGCDIPGFITGRFPSTCNASGATFGGSAANANYCAGTVSIPADIEASSAAGAATISNNILGPNCTCGASSC